jgi:hypothetical protein
MRKLSKPIFAANGGFSLEWTVTGAGFVSVR